MPQLKTRKTKQLNCSAQTHSTRVPSTLLKHSTFPIFIFIYLHLPESTGSCCSILLNNRCHHQNSTNVGGEEVKAKSKDIFFFFWGGGNLGRVCQPTEIQHAKLQKLRGARPADLIQKQWQTPEDMTSFFNDTPMQQG